MPDLWLLMTIQPLGRSGVVNPCGFLCACGQTSDGKITQNRNDLVTVLKKINLACHVVNNAIFCRKINVIVEMCKWEYIYKGSLDQKDSL